MKILFISDIHGIKTNLPKIKVRFKELNCNKLIVLGDLYYNGNKMFKDYAPNYVREFLESFKENLICIKGNCDSEADKLSSNFLIVDELVTIKTTNNNIYLTHGHIYNEHNWNRTNSILVYGHSHKPFIKESKTNIYISPGSISLPRNNIGPTYLYYDENQFIIYDINDHEIAKKVLKT